MAIDLAAAEKRIRLALASDLRRVRPHHACGYGGRGLARRRRHQFRIARRGHLELDVDAIGQRSGYSPAVARDALGRAAAAAAAVAAMAARAGVHCRHELEARRELHLPRGARNRHATGLDRLAQRLEDVAVELPPLVEEK